jgi:peptidoglycan/LPS O-acetylase OafA/YrhL
MGQEAPRAVLLRLTSLRAAAALMVFAAHVDGHGVLHLGRPVALGYTGVSFFFVLSGYVLTWSWSDRVTKQVFWRNRFARIYPATVVSVIAALVLPVTDVRTHALGLIASIFLVQAWVPHDSVAYATNGVTWSLSCEAFFYLMLPLIIVGLNGPLARRRWLISSCFLTAAAVFVAVTSHAIGGPVMDNVNYANPALRLSEFLVGVTLALAMKEGWHLKLSTFALITVLSVGIAIWSIFATSFYPIADELLCPFYAALIAVVARRDMTQPRGLLSSKYLVYAGSLSMCFYLVHELVMINLQHWYHHHGVSTLVLTFFVSCVAAAGLHHFVELPFQVLIRGRASASRSIATHASTVNTLPETHAIDVHSQGFAALSALRPSPCQAPATIEATNHRLGTGRPN